MSTEAETTSPGPGAPPPAPRREDHIWDRTAWVWDVVFLLGLLATVMVNLPGLASDRHRVVVVGVSVALAVWYAFTGAQALHRGKPHLGIVYLFGAAAAFVVLLVASADLGFVLFLFIPQVFIFVERLLYASLTILAMYVGLAVAVLLRVDGENVTEVLLTIGVSAAFSVVIGAWISGIIRQSVRRAELIAELETTRAALAAERHEAGALAERQRLAADIHDTLAQGFTSILMLTQGAEAALAAADGKSGDGTADTVRDQLQMIERTARENLAEARSLVAALTPADLDGASLAEALRRLADRHTAETGVPAEVAVHGLTDRLDQDADVVLLRAAQEALANARKHAGASTVSLTLRYGGADTDEPGRTVLTVVDDGKGFAPEQADGYGLRGMRTRVENSGGELTVDSAPGRGTRIEVSLP